MKQISKRITFLFSLRRKKINDVLKKYNINEHEYYLLLELSLNNEMLITEFLKSQQLNEKILYNIILSLEKKGYVTIQNNRFLVTKKFYKIEESINYDLKKIDDDFSKKMDRKAYNEYIRVLDELIDYYEE